jgi:hypothetical protein
MGDSQLRIDNPLVRGGGLAAPVPPSQGALIVPSHRHIRPALLLSAVLALVVFVAPSYGALTAPSLTGPANSATVDSPPVFTWGAVSGADHYVFQLGGSTGFNPPQFTVSTKNTRVALTTSIANADYTWRVAAVTAAGVQGAWSSTRSFTEDWADQPQPQSPADNSTLTYPDPMLLNWTSVPGAQEYTLVIATDPQLSSTVAGSPITTASSAYAITSRLPNNQYWWQVTPIDAEGNLGTPSAVFSFNWSWPNDTTLTLDDLDPSSQVFDPQLSWTPIPGAAYYKVDVNADPNFPSGSSVCCSGYTVATSLAPTTLLPAAQSYYWRVTPYNSSLQAGTPTVYSDGNGNPKTFTISYDAGANAVSNLSMRDDQDNAITWTSAGVDTTDPIISWDPTPGAASYEVQVSPYGSGACDWSTKTWDVTTVSTHWTPLGSSHGVADPWPNPQTLSTDNNGLTPSASYCARVRAQRNSDTSNHVVVGTWTNVGDDTDPTFNFTGYPTGNACSSCTSGYLGAADYELPITGQITGSMPLFTWKPITGYASYYVVVATDASFQNVIDYAWTRTPAYAPRTGNGVTDYPDSTYYWAVLPATGTGGTGVVARPDLAPTETFQKQSAAPTLSAPADTASISTWPVFSWTPVDGAYVYHVQVATDSTFSNLVDNVLVDETSYTAASTYPAGTTLYWRVQAEAKGVSTPVGLAWSSTGHFTKTLPVPSFSSPTTFNNATTGDGLPIWQWNPVPGAVSYDVLMNCGTGMFCTNATGLDSTVVTFSHLTGTKAFTWQVRANFPTIQNGSPSTPVPGAPTSKQPFQRTISAPTGLTTSLGNLHSFSMRWSPKAGAKNYKFEVSTSQAQNADGSFTSPFETFTTDTTSATPTMTNTFSTYQAGGPLHWHVAAIDADGNVGAFSPVQTMTLPLKLVMSSSRFGIVHKVTTSVTVTITNARGNLISGVNVKVTGPGITAKTLKTGTGGKVTFKLKPTKKGNVTFTATKTNCTTTTLKVPVL